MDELIYKYLGYRDIKPDENTLKLIEECKNLVKEKSRFKYIYQEFNEPFDFLLLNENYVKYLNGSSSYLLCATTIGIEIDKYQKLLEKTDITKAIIFDCVASAYIETLADEYEKNLNRDLSYRFCPGYQGTSFLDNQKINKIIKADKHLGITFLDSGLMVPLKSMMGIVAVGNHKKRSCSGCIFMKNCKYLKGGSTCYKK